MPRKPKTLAALERELGSDLERSFLTLIAYRELPAPYAEYRFDPARDWRFDFAWPGALLAVELEGGTWSGGRHSRGKGMTDDCWKYNAALLAGWRVLRFTSDMLRDHPNECLNAVEQGLTQWTTS